MSLKTEVAKQIIGKTIHDSYGREYGRILGFSTGPQGRVSLVWIERSNGEFSNCPTSQIILEKELVTLDTSWTAKANRLGKELTTILRKISALNKLHTNGEIAKEAYDNLQKQYERVIQSLTNRHQTLSKNAKDRLEPLTSQIDQIKFFLAEMKVDHSLGLIEEETYRDTSESLQVILNRALLEKNDVEVALDELASVSLHPPTFTQFESKREEAPSQPIVLRIEEAEL